jgi:hypothetical protein
LRGFALVGDPAEHVVVGDVVRHRDVQRAAFAGLRFQVFSLNEGVLRRSGRERLAEYGGWGARKHAEARRTRAMMRDEMRGVPLRPAHLRRPR